MTPRDHVAAELRAARARRRLSRIELAESSGVSVMTIMRYELAQREPTVSKLLQLCEALGVPAADILPPFKASA